MKAVIILLILIFAVGGIVALGQALGILGGTVWAFITQIFPVLLPTFQQSFEDYLTSAYFIVGVIIFIGSSAGIYFTVRQKKWLYFGISLLLDIISIISIASNLTHCS